MDTRKEEIFRDLISRQVPVMPGAMELITDLSASGFLLGIGSSGPPENVRLVIDRLNLASVLSGYVTGMDVTRGKPDPQVFLMTAERMNIEPARCAVVEDAVHGITAARRAGMKAVALTGTAVRAAFRDADLVVDSLTELGGSRIVALIDGKNRP
jgi:HAD superfamily hydrolase (TIGR01509 family)